MKEVRPIKDKKKYSKDIEKKISDFFNAVIFDRIIEILKRKPLINTNNDIINAINDGRIQYVDGKFSGKFDARVSKSLVDIGANFDKRTGFFNLAQDKLPMEIRQTIAVTSSFYISKSLDIVNFLNSVNVNEAIQSFSISVDYGITLDDIDEQVKSTLKKDITVIPELTDEEKENIAQEYSNNMDLYIKNFTEEEINKLREKVEQNAFSGGRASNLEKIIKKEKEVSKNKARFLARQETSLLVSKYKEERYKTLGINKYKWQTSSDERVRQDHKDLDGTIQSFDSPPIVNKKTGRRANPGEDFGCRCLAIPLLN